MNEDFNEGFKKASPTKKAFWPASGKHRIGPQYKVNISLDRPMVDWLMENVVGQSSYFNDLEETIITALRCLCGPQGRMDTEVLGELRDDVLPPEKGWLSE